VKVLLFENAPKGNKARKCAPTHPLYDFCLLGQCANSLMLHPLMPLNFDFENWPK